MKHFDDRRLGAAPEPKTARITSIGVLQKRCSACRRPRLTEGGTYRGGQFVCKDCR